ncbi:hypothetical protein [Desulfomarina profundi]|nr:hypothetical protein [Desulfomarina profundi]
MRSTIRLSYCTFLLLVCLILSASPVFAVTSTAFSFNQTMEKPGHLSMMRTAFHKKKSTPEKNNNAPGRVLILLTAGNEKKNSTILNRIILRYNLILTSRKKLSRLNHELVILTTTSNVKEICRKIQKENQNIRVQPDYYYSTLGDKEEKKPANLFRMRV